MEGGRAGVEGRGIGVRRRRRFTSGRGSRHRCRTRELGVRGRQVRKSGWRGAVPNRVPIAGHWSYHAGFDAASRTTAAVVRRQRSTDPVLDCTEMTRITRLGPPRRRPHSVPTASPYQVSDQCSWSSCSYDEVQRRDATSAGVRARAAQPRRPQSTSARDPGHGTTMCRAAARSPRPTSDNAIRWPPVATQPRTPPGDSEQLAGGVLRGQGRVILVVAATDDDTSPVTRQRCQNPLAQPQLVVPLHRPG